MKGKIRNSKPYAGLVLVVLLCAAAFAYAMFQGGFVSWFLFYSSLPILLYIFSVAVFPMRSLEVKREINNEQFASGSVMRVNLIITKNSWIPLFYVVVEDCLPNRLMKCANGDGLHYRDGSRALFFPGFKRKVEFSYTVEPLPRGEFHLSEISMKTGDIFGFIEKTVSVEARQNVLVYPRYENIYSWDPLEQHEQGSRRGLHSFEHDNTSVSTIRDYAPGDRLSWLDWKSTARTRKMLTKEFDRPVNEDLIICLDRRSSIYSNEDPNFERAVSASASMVRYAIKHGSSTGFVSFGKDKTLFPLGTGNEQQWRIFYHLAGVKPDGKGNYMTVVHQAFRRFHVKSNIIYITPKVDESALSLLTRLAKERYSVDLFLCTDEKAGPNIGETEIERLRSAGIGAFFLNGKGINDAIKEGMRYATN